MAPQSMIRLEGADLGPFSSMSVLAVAGTLLLATTLAACGGSDGGDAEAVDSAGEREGIAAAFDAVRGSVAKARPDLVCADLGPAARDQVSKLGHGAQQDCYGGVAMLLEGLKKERRGGAMPAADVSEVKVKLTAVATLAVGGEKIRVPFVQERGRWKLDSFYGLTPRPSVAIP